MSTVSHQTSKGRHKKSCFFFSFSERGGLAESKISLAEKTEICLDFFWQKGGKGGGVSPIPKGFYHKILIFSSNTEFFFLGIFRQKKGGGLARLGKLKKKTVSFLCLS